MIFKLGQKVKYKRISKKLRMQDYYLNPDDLIGDEEKSLERRKIIKLEKERIGFIVGRRKKVFKTYLKIEYRSEDDYPLCINQPDEWLNITKQIFGFVYLIAYDMGKTNYVLEKDLEVVV